MNAKQEFLEKTKNDKIIYALIWKENRDGDKVFYKLNLNYTDEEYKKFVQSLDFNYDSGFGIQELFGYILCDNGVWFERGEYDGSEWWNRNKYPLIGEIDKLAGDLK